MFSLPHLEEGPWLADTSSVLQPKALLPTPRYCQPPPNYRPRPPLFPVPPPGSCLLPPPPLPTLDGLSLPTARDYNLQPKFEENLHLQQKVKIYNLQQKFIKIYNFQIHAFLPLLTFNQAILLINRGKMPYIRNMSVPIESYQHNKNMPQRNVYIQYTFNKLSNVWL